MKTLLYVLNQYPSLSQTFVRNEIEGLRGRGYDVNVVSSREGDYHEPGVIVLERASLLKVMQCHGRLLLRDARTYLRFLRAFSRTGVAALPWSLHVPYILDGLHVAPTHIHSHFANRSAALARVLAQTLKVPRSVTTHAVDIYRPSRYVHRQLQGAAIATVTSYNRDVLGRLGHHDAAIVRCGVEDLSGYRSSTGASVERARPLVVTVGRLVEKKGHDLLIRAVAVLRDGGVTVDCVIVGEGPLRAKLESLARSLGVTDLVRFKGALTHEMTLCEMAEADVFVLACRRASDGDLDGLPVAILEAASMRIPIVGSPVGGIGEFLTDRTGHTFPDGDAAQLAGQLRAALDDADPGRVDEAHALVRSVFAIERQLDGVERLMAEAMEAYRADR